MRVAIIGAGPTGLFLGAALARRGHRVTAVDRDPGPTSAQPWPRRGVMQFHHAHAFRPQVVEALAVELPEALDAWLDAGAERVTLPLPDGREAPGGMRSRRETFERALRATALRQVGLRLVVGHVDGVTRTGGRADGLLVTGPGAPEHVPADLVIDA